MLLPSIRWIYLFMHGNTIWIVIKHLIIADNKLVWKKNPSPSILSFGLRLFFFHLSFTLSALTFQVVSGKWITLKYVSLSSYQKQRLICFAWACLAGWRRMSCETRWRCSDVLGCSHLTGRWTCEKHSSVIFIYFYFFICFCFRSREDIEVNQKFKTKDSAVLVRSSVVACEVLPAVGTASQLVPQYMFGKINNLTFHLLLTQYPSLIPCFPFVGLTTRKLLA